MAITDCDPERLVRYLAGESEPGEARVTEHHLDHCVPCRESMERQAASPYFWCAAAENLETRPEDSCPTLLDQSAIRDALDAATDSNVRLGDWLGSSNDPGSFGRIDGYEVRGVVGQGGMAVVLRAMDVAQQRPVAIKTLKQHLAASPDARGRFWREAQIAASLHSQHVIPILKIGSWRDVPYLVMPLVSQGSLSDWVRSHTLTLDDALHVGHQVALGLATAHRRGMVHRDIKPSNILLMDGTDWVVIADFGLARILGDDGVTLSGTLMGTPQFMSPEQALGDEVDTRSDLFSLGSLMYWMCDSRSPFAADTNLGTLGRIIHAPHAPLAMRHPEIPAWFDRLLDRLLAKDPSQRPWSADRVAEVLQALIAHRAAPHAHPLPLELAEPISTRRAPLKWPLAVAAPVACAVVACAIVIGMAIRSARSDSSAATAVSPSGGRTSDDVTLTTQGDSPFSDKRQGPLDELDRLNLLDDLAAGKQPEYWLRRLATLPVAEVPPAAVPHLQRLTDDPDQTIRQLAEVVLTKDPFEEVDGITAENPFVLLEPSEE